MELFIETAVHYLGLVAEGIAALFILAGMAMGATDYVRYGLLAGRPKLAIAKIRNDVGHMLSLALEFLIGADILKTAVSPSWTDIGQLAAIVGIRTILNFFLMQELQHFGTGEDAQDPEEL